jgi:hypothetical protein
MRSMRSTGVAGGLVACADYGASLAMDQLLMRSGKYNRQSEASRLRLRSLTARGAGNFWHGRDYR